MELYQAFFSSTFSVLGIFLLLGLLSLAHAYFTMVERL